VFTYVTAASAARRESGSAAGPLSWVIIASTRGSPFGGGSVETETLEADDGPLDALEPELLQAASITVATAAAAAADRNRPFIR
jgi:hypothetical protein